MDKSRVFNDRSNSSRLPHAVLDLPSRRYKGLKIERLLNLSTLRQPIEMLEVEDSRSSLAKTVAGLPDVLLDRLAPINPTLIFRLTRT